MAESYPDGFMTLRAVFERTLAVLANLNKFGSLDAGAAGNLDEFDDCGLATDPRFRVLYPNCSPSPATIANAGWGDGYEAELLRVERRLREAIVDEEFDVWVKASNGQMEHLVIVREDWLKEQFGGLGIDQIPYHFVDMNGAPAFPGYLKNSDFEKWWLARRTEMGLAGAACSVAAEESAKPVEKSKKRLEIEAALKRYYGSIPSDLTAGRLGKKIQGLCPGAYESTPKGDAAAKRMAQRIMSCKL
jgi:hypothetical protein